jgi:hypothetical protein|nr:MAG TPA: hypothetical protein [Crassvirales sp.]
MKIKGVPTNRKDYYEKCIGATKLNHIRCSKVKDELIKEIQELYDDIVYSKEVYLNDYKLNLEDYSEFVDNTYTTGEFLHKAKVLFYNRRGGHELIMELFDLYSLAKKQKAIYNLDKQLHTFEKILALTPNQYLNIVKAYYTEVQRQLILEGAAYKFDNGIGYICFNRCRPPKKAKLLDFMATRNKKKEILARGGKIYNKIEHDWCLKNGVEYKYEDHKVFKHDEYYYQYCLLYPHVQNMNDLVIESADYRSAKLRGKTLDDLIKDCNYDVNEICKLDVDIRVKLTLCDRADKILYTKFIRNENQESYKTWTFGRKD